MAWDDFLKPKDPSTGEPLPNNNSDGQNHPFGDPNASTLANDPWSQENWLDKLKAMADGGNIGALEMLINHWSTEDSQKTAREWTAQREDSSYQRLMSDLKAAGISPYILSGASPMASASAGKSYSGSQMTSQANNRRNQETNNLKAILQILGVVIGAIAMAS